MTTSHRVAKRVWVPVAVVAAIWLAAVAAAQTQTAVVVSTTTLFIQPGFKSAAESTVKAGTVVEVLGQEGDFYRVRLPADAKGVSQIGYIRAAHLKVGPAPAGPQQKPAAPAKKPPAVRVRVFADVGYHLFLATESFETLFGTSGSPYYGGGAEVEVWRDLFVRVSAGRMKQEGERAFVHDGKPYRLGIPLTVTLTPVDVTVGWSSRVRRRLRAYVGAGAGLYQYRETSSFAQSGENVSENAVSYHGLGGAAYSIWKWIAFGGEVQFTSATGVLGEGGVSKEYGEKNLGGTTIRAKVIFGWQ